MMMALKLKATEMVSQFHPLHSPIARLLPWRKLRLLQMVDYKSTSGTAWSHSFLNQKPWHPLSYPNQRKKWITEQQHARHQRRNEEAYREYAQEQEFFRQAALYRRKRRKRQSLHGTPGSISGGNLQQFQNWNQQLPLSTPEIKTGMSTMMNVSSAGPEGSLIGIRGTTFSFFLARSFQQVGRHMSSYARQVQLTSWLDISLISMLAYMKVAVALEKAALSDEYFIKRKLYPNVDFYSGLIYR